MSSIEAYLNSACSRLQVDPAQSDDIREELRAHLEELMQAYSAGGIDRKEATELALAWFGSAHKLNDSLNLIHRGDAWWIYRLKGLALGMIIGGLLALLIPMGGHFEFITGFFAIPYGIEASRLHILINALVVGGVIGLLATGGRGLLVGWSVGSLVWLTEYVVYWIISVASDSPPVGASLSMLNALLLAPLLGGVFGAAVGLSSTAAQSIAARLRPQVR
ncbi:MAG: hypothetical protein GTN69_08630 [Armatimonadetes bacterium]|nr:hypothetical protein [Armatimonadota bacterium]NIO75929.1 hypothetical protein [Armatimonadota bacterium]NIO98741.1 hypothetical protein [Armatimonadota bacterium]